MICKEGGEIPPLLLCSEIDREVIKLQEIRHQFTLDIKKDGIQKTLLYHKKVLPLKAINLVNKNIEP